MVDQWKVNTSYTLGTQVLYNGAIYTCQIAHTSQSDWTPDVTPALWITTSTITKPTPIPSYGYYINYNIGDKVVFKGSIFTCLVAHQVIDNGKTVLVYGLAENIWDPEVYTKSQILLWSSGGSYSLQTSTLVSAPTTIPYARNYTLGKNQYVTSAGSIYKANLALNIGPKGARLTLPQDVGYFTPGRAPVNIWSVVTVSSPSSTSSSTSSSSSSSTTTSTTTTTSTNRPVSVYHQTWSSPWQSDPSKLDFINLNSKITHLIFSFINPNCSYIKGSNSWSGSGVSFSSDFSVIKAGIALLKKNNPNIKVQFAVGGATYSFPSSTVIGSHLESIRDFIDDIGADGIDLDFEETDSSKFASILKFATNVFKSSSYILSVASWSVGCYGTGSYKNSLPSSAHTGMNLSGIQTYGNQLAYINLMSYDAGDTYSPTEAFDSVRSVYSGPIAMGFEVGTQGWGGHLLSQQELSSSIAHVKKDQKGGIMIWSLQKSNNSSTPTVAEILNSF